MPLARNVASTQLRRASPAENVKMGLSKTARNYVLKDAKRITKRTPHISMNAFINKQTRERTGLANRGIATKERKAGRLGYLQFTTAKYAQYGRFVKQWVPEMTPKDRAIPFKWFEGYDRKEQRPAHNLSIEDNRTFRQMFRRYNADAVRQLFGSEPRDLGSFPVAA